MNSMRVMPLLLAIIEMNETIIRNISREFRVSDLFLFGDYTTQKDLDILVISNDFRNISRTKRKMLIKKCSPQLDPICLTNKEFQKLKKSMSSLWIHISTKGQRIL